MVDLYYALYGKKRPVCLLEMDVANNFREFIREHNIPTIKKIAKSLITSDNQSTGKVDSVETTLLQSSSNVGNQTKSKPKIRKIKTDDNTNDYTDNADLNPLSPNLLNNISDRGQKSSASHEKGDNAYLNINDKNLLKKKEIKGKPGDRVTSENDNITNYLNKNSEMGQSEIIVKNNIMNTSGVHNYGNTKIYNRSVRYFQVENLCLFTFK